MLALNLYMLSKYRDVFNGRRIVFAVEEEGLVDQTHLGWMFNDTHDIRPYELVMVPADLENKESACLSKMLEMVQSSDPDEVSFFAHAKDTSLDVLAQHDVAELSDWVRDMYHNNLSNPSLVDTVMDRHPCAGTFKHVESQPLSGGWNYTGNFFWVNHQRLFTKNWKDSIGANVNDFLSSKFSSEEAYNFGRDYLGKLNSSTVVKNWDPSRVTVVTTCKNRWGFLKKSLLTWLNKGFKKIIIVDWDSKVEVASKLEKLSEGINPITVIRVENEDIFNGGLARNTGARFVTSEYALFIDSDMTIKDWSQAGSISMVPGKFYHGPHNIPPFGTGLVRMDDFQRINGYSELYPSYGWEDNDLYNRLEESGLQRCFFDERMVEHIEHNDELRTRHRDQRGRKLHETIWENRDKIEKWTSSHRREEKMFTKHEFFL
jgi:hypothetical protein